jgi:hypothetical protein
MERWSVAGRRGPKRRGVRVRTTDLITLTQILILLLSAFADQFSLILHVTSTDPHPVEMEWPDKVNT